MMLVLALALATESLGNVALMTFSMEMPYGLEQVAGKRPDGNVILTKGGDIPWMRAGFGRRPKIGADPVTIPPAWSGFALGDQHIVPVGRRTAVVTVGTGKLADGRAIVVFDAVLADKGIPSFVMEAIVPAENADVWVAELERSLRSVTLQNE